MGNTVKWGYSGQESYGEFMGIKTDGRYIVRYTNKSGFEDLYYLKPKRVEFVDGEPDIVKEKVIEATIEKPIYVMKDGYKWYGTDFDLQKVTDGETTKKEIMNKYEAEDSVKVGDSLYQMIYIP